MTHTLRATRAAVVARCRIGRAPRRCYALTTNMATKSTVNDDEIAHFSRLSEHWWDETGEFGMLHKLNPVRAKFIRDRILRTIEDEGHPDPGVSRSGLSKPLEGFTVVDVGCGGGLLSEACPARFHGWDHPKINGTIVDPRPHGGQDTCYRCVLFEYQDRVRSCVSRSLSQPSNPSFRAAVRVQTYDIRYSYRRG